jgi:hypothetical protein
MAVGKGEGKSGSAGVAPKTAAGGVVVPEGVTLEILKTDEGEEFGRSYKYSTESGNTLNFEVTSGGIETPRGYSGRAAFEVSFTVNENYNRAESFSPREGGRIATKARSIMRADARSRPDGFNYSTVASSADGLGGIRARLYSRAGFSDRGALDRTAQYSSVKDGKLVPGLS